MVEIGVEVRRTLEIIPKKIIVHKDIGPTTIIGKAPIISDRRFSS